MDVGFVWDENKYQTTVKKHDVRFYEVVSAFDDPLITAYNAEGGWRDEYEQRRRI